MAARLFLPCVLILTLCSCASLPKEQVVFVPPEVNCGAYELPKIPLPTEPEIGEKDVGVWQLYAYAWQAMAEHIFGQRLETAKCLHTLKQQGIIKG